MALAAIAAAALATPASAATSRILVLGDSLSAGYGIDPAKAWPALLQARLGAEYSVTNASVSGETTAGGLSRLPALLERHRPRLVILALGANDGLRGLPLGQMRANLAAMLGQIERHQARGLLVGIRLPPNYGPYATEFAGVFAELSQAEEVPLVPFLLEGFADQPAYFQADGLHPTAAAQPLILDNLLASVRKALR
jgi:acyl-CoA thioesterase-1